MAKRSRLFARAAAQRRGRRRQLARRLAVGLVLAGLPLLGAGVAELRSSRLQARYLASVSRDLGFELRSGPSDAIQFPDPGPYDLRLGYALMPGMLDVLEARGYETAAQARSTARALDLMDMGGFAIYRETSQAGLTLLERDDEELFAFRVPRHTYGSFHAVPEPVVEALLFLENRELLDETRPHMNPAVEWDRLARAMLLRAVRRGEGRSPGGSTLATQIEKFRHSRDGVTLSTRDKARQMASASLRAYLDGERTLAARQRVVVDYLDSVPLSATPGYGEVLGLRDSLWAWYGADPDVVDQQLRRMDPHGPVSADQARAYRLVLSLLLSQKRPTHYLVGDVDALTALTDAHLQLMAREGVIGEMLADAALQLRPYPLAHAPAEPQRPFSERKTVTSLRTDLLPVLGLDSVYDLDRLDLIAHTTIDGPAQLAVHDALRSLADPAAATEAGMKAHTVIRRGDPSAVIYSFTLLERVEGANVVRVQADSYDQPLDINQGVKLELGSTAKLRTLVTYLELVAELHAHHAHLSTDELRTIEIDRLDTLTRWAVDHLARAEDRSLPAMLDAAMARTWSASTAETFFTGGGAHRFHNFDGRDNGRVLTGSDALTKSVNLPFIRMIREEARYCMFRVPGASARILHDPDDPTRQVYLERFADEEGQVFLRRFLATYGEVPPEARVDRLLAARKPSPTRLAVVHRSVYPAADMEAFGRFLRDRLPDSTLSDETISTLYERYGTDQFHLADRGYLAGVHPLELWLVGYLEGHPGADQAEVLAASAGERQHVYGWLFKTRRKHAQDIRIRTLLEVEAFLDIHRRWQRVGYPFGMLVPSYATAIGSSGDRPAALAELMGIILAGGVRYPTARFDAVHLAEGTPYESLMVRAAHEGERVMQPEVAAVLRRELAGVVDHGTARRVKGAFVLADGTVLPVGGKTGTGDNRHRIFGPDGAVQQERFLNRTATFVFYVGDRFFGTVVAYVPGEQAGDFRFTSALPVQVLADLAPVLVPLLERGDPGETTIPAERGLPPASP